jgi:hypothetical protein
MFSLSYKIIYQFTHLKIVHIQLVNFVTIMFFLKF